MRGLTRTELTSRVEHLLEVLLNGKTSGEPHEESVPGIKKEALKYECRNTRIVAFGGGTGLSTVIGGNSRLKDWAEDPFVGLKEEFSSIDVVVCTTDDGGSTGLLLQQLPLIGIGDLRKLLLSLMLRENLRSSYNLDDDETLQLASVIHRIFNFRFLSGPDDWRYVSDPILLIPDDLREFCPEPLVRFLRSLGQYISPGGEGTTLRPGGHCLGNLLLVAAILRESCSEPDCQPESYSIKKALDSIALAIGVTPGRIHPATAVQGQLVLRYANGIAVRGQRKSALCRRYFPIDRVAVEYCGPPAVSPELCRSIEAADMIIFAPGSLYTSLMPIFQLPPIVSAIRKNKRALKILGANFWVQEGETDISRRSRYRGFYVSELLDAYEQNVQGGIEGLFDVVLSANLEHVPGSVLRNYALEGKSPIYMDRQRVEQFGVMPLEATIYSRRRLNRDQVIHHDPKRFALAVRSLVFAHQQFNLKCETEALVSPLPPLQNWSYACIPPLCTYREAAREVLEGKRFHPEELRETMLDIIWENRDIRIEHLKFFAGLEMISAENWHRSKEWDNVLGYYDPEDGMLKVHEQLRGAPEKVRENILIALGESLLGRYIQSRRLIPLDTAGGRGAKFYEITLHPVDERGCFLSDSELHAYLTLARMARNTEAPTAYRMSVNDQDGFLPPGLRFGLLYAWYLNNAYAEVMEYEMSVLRWPPQKLIPHQALERERKQALIAFFRDVVFQHVIDKP